MGNKAHFFRQSGGGLELIADYQFNNNLIDDVGGNNGTGTNITFSNNEAVFNSVNNSRVSINNLGAFNFTDGVNDLPFKIETSVVLNSLPSGGGSGSSQIIIGKFDNTSTLANYQLISRVDGFQFSLLSTNPLSVLGVRLSFSQNLLLNTVYDITITYDGSKTLAGLIMEVNGTQQTGNATLNNYTGQENSGVNVYLGIAGFGLTTNRLYFDGKMDYLKIYK